jgi:hypothetical protein
MPEPRPLSFHSLDEVMPEVDRLLAGHTTTGAWTLAQILDHLATAVRLTCLGRRETASEPRSEVLKRKFFRAGKFPTGVQAPHPSLFPAAGLDPREQAEALRQALARFLAAPGPFPDHPLLGALDKGEWAQFHCIHCAHHLGFAHPVGEFTGPRRTSLSMSDPTSPGTRDRSS